MVPDLDGFGEGLRVVPDEVLDDFVTESHCDLASLRDAAGRGVADDVRRQAHRINGASRMVGAREIRDLASRIEREAGNEAPDWPSIRELLDPLAESLARVAEVAGSRREGAR